MSEHLNRTGQVTGFERLCPSQGSGSENAYRTAHAARIVPGASWITQGLFDATRRLWSLRYGYELPDKEVIEILMNVKNLARVLREIGGQNDEQ